MLLSSVNFFEEQALNATSCVNGFLFSVAYKNVSQPDITLGFNAMD